MKITINITACNKCPYYKWEVNNSESNSAGSSNCSKKNMVIAYETPNPKTPSWCPLKPTDLEDNLSDLEEGSMKDKYRFAKQILESRQ